MPGSRLAGQIRVNYDSGVSGRRGRRSSTLVSPAVYCISGDDTVRCLALNASFEPLTMVPLRRALRLVIDGKAEIVESDSDRLIRSERLTFPRPAVIRLT